MPKTKIYHNPRCSKNRQALALLEDKGVEAEVVHYLDRPPALDELRAIVVAGKKAAMGRPRENVLDIL